MASNLHNLLATLLFLSLLLFPERSTSQECQYPCYPPPTGSGNNPTPVNPAPPSPPAGGSFSPPISTTPPTGYLPYITPPAFVNGLTPPPPEPILPWFPYYYRRPPHADQSSSTALQGSSTKARITIITILVFILFSFFQ